MTDKAELDLMSRVKRLAGPYLSVFSPSSSVPEAFWAALTANESGAYLIHDTVIPPRFEQVVYNRLMDVIQGMRSKYGSIDAKKLAGSDEPYLQNLASSWGLTQIMGYHALEWGVPIADLNDPAKHYPLAARLMAIGIQEFGIDASKEFEEMFRFWNTGHPAGKTFAENYVPNGLKRMQIWETL